ncbi:MAG: amidase, partial [Pseudomonadota bacterium]
MSVPLSAVEVAEKVASGALAVRDVAEACLQKIEARDGEVKAFAHIDPSHVRAQADALDRYRKSGRAIGPMHGVPVALKDIIDTADYPTENGSPLDAGRRPERDATIAARLRASGALIIGKTVTTEFAFLNPGPTRNPHNLGHTPGGSSSGSAAAVADGMVPLAIGSQTAGSTIRPGAFCGVVAYKPTHGTVSLTGVLNLCESLDTAGMFATSLADAALLTNAVQGYDPSDQRTRPIAHDDLLAAVRSEPPVTPTLAMVKGPTWSEASEDTRGLMDEVAETLGERADWVDLPRAFDTVMAAQRMVMTVGFAKNLRHYYERDAGAFSDILKEAYLEGVAHSARDYLAARELQGALAGGLNAVFDRYDAIVTPSAIGEAPDGIGATGTAVFNAL